MKSDEGVVPDVVPSGVGAVSGDETDLPPPMNIYAHELKEDFEQVRVAMAKFA
ncbi:MAG TPA: hypothetical protein QF694_02265 [Dehalococcoidia bacterium]|nr:hypothetical protein [Dehalococcoidia bacterium]HJP27621.1 hypothetical protein [Dehalococcoidia bacterium]